MKKKVKPPSKFEILMANIRSVYDDFMFKYGPERIELARNRLLVYKAFMEGKWHLNPYTEPESDWFDYTEDT